MEQKAQLAKTLKRFWQLQKPYWPIFALALAAVLLFETANLAEKFLFKYVVDNGTFFAAGTLERQAFLSVLFVAGILFCGVIITKSTMQWLQFKSINALESRTITDLKRKFFNHILGLSHNFHTTHRTGSMIARLTRGARAIERMMDVVLFNFATVVFQSGAGIISLLAIEPAAAVVIICTFAVFITFSLAMQRIMYPASLRQNVTDDTEKGNISDFFTNIDSIKYFGKEENIKERYYKLSEDTRKAMLKSWDYWPWIAGGQHAILSLGTITLVAVSAKSFLAGTTTIGTLVFVYTIYLGLLGPMFRFVSSLRDFYQSSADFESLYQYDEIHNEIKDKPNAPKLEIKRGTVEYKDITFLYGKRKLFTKFNLRIKQGEKVAIVGSSGAGKSTLVKLLYRLYDPQKGAVFIDGVNIKDVEQESLRSELTIVPQECILFDDTIYNNISFSKPGATREQVFAAIKFSQLDKFIRSLPKQENTIVGERGVKLSGGEKQRVSIARALLADKKILVLDEATSSLDSETEHEIQRDLHRLMKKRTSIIIAHRLSTIMAADRIIVLEDRKIVQQGTHNQLIRQKGRYHALWELQKGGYI